MIAKLAGASRIAIDTAAFIYFMEDHPVFGPIVEPLFVSLDEGRMAGVSSELTLLEVLVRPLAEQREDLANAYRRLLLDSESLSLHPIDRAVLEEAARIRARYRFRSPDAIQLATARLAGVDAFITNDVRLSSFAGVPVVVLADAVHPSGE
ncbi:type II toxin-antitoxin system VapC family toxin [Sorangium sp. So ce1036]|uniref:type II toxin-antitoxin system VapC family toxin n=1 Tax=Sorangium sp. So ce1036 TaxID=3133328 RepID=UPI003F0D2555